MVRFAGLEAYARFDDTTRVDEHRRPRGNRRRNMGDLFDGHHGQPTVYVEMPRHQQLQIVVRCTAAFSFEEFPDLEVRCLANNRRVWVGYISKASQDQTVRLEESNSAELTLQFPQILAGVHNSDILSTHKDGQISYHIEVWRGKKLPRNGPPSHKHTFFQRAPNRSQNSIGRPMRCTIKGESRASLVSKGIIDSEETEDIRESTLVDDDSDDVAASIAPSRSEPTFMGGLPLPSQGQMAISRRSENLPVSPMSTLVGVSSSVARKRGSAEDTAYDEPMRKRGRTYAVKTPPVVIDLSNDNDSDGDNDKNSNDITARVSSTISAANGRSSATATPPTDVTRRASELSSPRPASVQGEINDARVDKQYMSNGEDANIPSLQHFDSAAARPCDVQGTVDPRDESITSADQKDDLLFVGSSPVPQDNTNGTIATARNAHGGQRALRVRKALLEEKRAKYDLCVLERELAEAELMAKQR